MRVTLLVALLLPLAAGAWAQSAKVYPADAEAAATAARIRALGYHCPKVWWLERVEVDHRGDKHYKLACGGQGPFYRTTVRANGQQSIRPW